LGDEAFVSRQRVGQDEQWRVGERVVPRASSAEQRFREPGRGIGEKSGSVWPFGEGAVTKRSI
jgi:hypothetical protein